MAEISLKIPQIGEGLQEARVVALLKKPGDMIRRDEVIYQMETDKAVMDVESPSSGRLVRWLAAADDVLAIGADVLILESDDGEVSSPPSSETMGSQEVALLIPQIGEGLQEARLVATLKQPGDHVKRDDVIYQMETDKAVMDVESPYEGTLVRWSATVDTVLAIGAEVGVILTQDVATPGHAPVVAAPSAPATPQPFPDSTRRRDIPPRTRAYAKEKGLTNEQMEAVPAAGARLMPTDIDAYLVAPAATMTGPSSSKGYVEAPLAAKQRVLGSRLVRGNQLVVPGMMSVVANWEQIERLRDEIKTGGGEFQPSTFTMFAYAVAKAATAHPIVRSTLIGDSTVRTYAHLQLGIAVARPGDELVVAVVENSDSLPWIAFASDARAKIQLARDGKDQANESVTLSITNMQGHGIRDAMAVVVPPGVATVFLGEAFNGLAQDTPELKLQRSCTIGITIDHRLINGVGGAEFLNEIKRNVENIRGLIEP